jgi:hypothetical protein
MRTPPCLMRAKPSGDAPDDINVAHGRNYQHLDERAADDAVIDDRRRILVLRDAVGANIGQLQSEIVEAAARCRGML